MESTPENLNEAGEEPFTEGDALDPERSATDPVMLDLLEEDLVPDSIFVQIDAAVSFVAVDIDGDTALDTAYIDLNGDGAVDVLVTRTADGYLLSDPTDSVEPQQVTRDQLAAVAPELVAALDVELPPALPEENQGEPVVPDPDSTGWSVEDGALIGDPGGDAEFWFEQAQNGFCLPASIAQIVSEYTGVVYEDEKAFVDIANDIGAFTVGYDGIPGIPFEKGVEILNEAGVPAEYRIGDLDTLAANLDAGYNMILFIDGGEIWTSESTEDSMPDHAVVVTGIDPEQGTVLLSDPGSPDGNMSEVPIDVFLDAWGDSENAMIVCDKAPEETTGGTGTLDPEEAWLDEGTRVDGAGASRRAETGGEEDEPGLLEATTSWAIRQPWILLPVSLPAPG